MVKCEYLAMIKFNCYKGVIISSQPTRKNPEKRKMLKSLSYLIYSFNKYCKKQIKNIFSFRIYHNLQNLYLREVDTLNHYGHTLPFPLSVNKLRI